MRGIHFFMFLVAIPALAALGHDLYLFYLHQETGFKFISIGWMWTHYHVESYHWVAEVTMPDLWVYIDIVLAQKAVFVGAGFAVFIYLLIGIVRVLKASVPSKGKTGSIPGRAEILGKDKKGKVQYNRK